MSKIAVGVQLPSDQNSTGRTFGSQELSLLAEVLASGTLTATKGVQTAAFQLELAKRLEVAHVAACSSGTAAIHTAISAVDPEPGEEIVTSAITDMGAITPILYQGAIPVFADVDPLTGNLTAESVETVLSERTRAVVVTHLFGNPSGLLEMAALCKAREILLIEDAAQAILAKSQGCLVGTVGDLGCFSFQQGKHLTSGEAGAVVTNNDALARRVRLFINKAWPYGEAGPDHEFIALNARLSELQSAVLRAQLQRLDAMVAQRKAMAALLNERLVGVPGIGLPVVQPGDEHGYWRFCLRIDPEVVPGGPDRVAAALARLDIPAAPRYIQKPAFRCRVIAEQRTFGNSRWPFTLARPEAVDYDAARFPGTFRMLEEALVLPWNERLNEVHIDALAEALISVVGA